MNKITASDANAAVSMNDKAHHVDGLLFKLVYAPLGLDGKSEFLTSKLNYVVDCNHEITPR